MKEDRVCKIVHCVCEDTGTCINVDLIEAALERINEIVRESIAKVQGLMGNDHIGLGTDRIVIGYCCHADQYLIFSSKGIDEGSNQHRAIMIVKNQGIVTNATGVTM
jgi:microsomal dipeptidase-like Zn-dependent dipeptidase